MNETPTSKETRTTNQGFDDVKEGLERLRKDVAELADIVKATAAERAASTRDQLDHEARRALEELQDRLDAMIGRARQTTDQVGDQISQHPVSSLVGAFGLGFILAMLLEKGGSAGPSS